MKKLLLIIALVFSLLTLYGCNKDVFDTVYEYDYALIALPDGSCIKVDVAQWCDYEGDQLQVTSTDGTVYLVHSSNCVLVNEK